MSQQCARPGLESVSDHESASAQQLRTENAELQQYLTAQRKVIASLERRAGRSLESLGVHLHHLAVPQDAMQRSPQWQVALEAVQNEVNSLSDLLADAMLLQKLEAGKVKPELEPVNLEILLNSITRHLLHSKSAYAGRLLCEFEPVLPMVLVDQEMTEAVLIDLLARSLKYSDQGSAVILSATQTEGQAQLYITAQRFSPIGDRDFATEIILCCRRIEVQNGQITCEQRTDGLQTVTITLKSANQDLRKKLCE